MRRRLPNTLVSSLLVLNALLVVLIVVILASRHEFLPAALAQAIPQRSSEIEVVPAQMSANTWGCYVVDKTNSTICAYQYVPGERMLKLQAARSFEHDLRLANFNTTPSPDDVRDLVEKERKIQPAK